MLLLIILPLTAVFVGLHFIIGNHALGELTKDPLRDLGVPYYTGAVSMIGVSMWLGAIFIMLLGWSLFRRSVHRREQAWFLAGFAVLTALLAFDDLFLLHEAVLPELGVPEELTMGFYAAFAAVLFLRFFRLILRHEPLILLASLGMLALSIFIDLLAVHIPFVTRLRLYAVEDGAKVIGILLWLLYVFRFVRRQAEPRPPTDSFAE